MVSATIPGGGFVLLDPRLDVDLLAEGFVNDVISGINSHRRVQAGLDVSDLADVWVSVPTEHNWFYARSITQHRERIMRDTKSANLYVWHGVDLDSGFAFKAGKPFNVSCPVLIRRSNG